MPQDSVEVEIKLRVADAGAARSRIESAGFSVDKPRILERNVIFDTADQSLRRRGELLRVRDMEGRGLVTFKGPSQPGRHKTREELESGVSNPHNLELVLSRIGFGPVFRYEKYRTEYRRGTEPGVITLDETPIGAFLELEGPSNWIDAVANELGFSESDYVVSSYGDLYLEHCSQHGSTPGDMVFHASGK